MSAERVWRSFLEDAIRNLELAREFAGSAGFSTFELDHQAQYAAIRALEIVGESVKRLPDEIKESHSDIPWRAMAGMRDRLIHGYDVVNLGLVYKTCIETAPIVAEKLRAILENSFPSPDV